MVKSRSQHQSLLHPVAPSDHRPSSSGQRSGASRYVSKLGCQLEFSKQMPKSRKYRKRAERNSNLQHISLSSMRMKLAQASLKILSQEQCKFFSYFLISDIFWNYIVLKHESSSILKIVPASSA